MMMMKNTFLSFLAHDSIYAEHAICYRPSICLSVCHKGGSVKNSWSKDHAIFTTQ